jgi:hypothetical protein
MERKGIYVRSLRKTIMVSTRDSGINFASCMGEEGISCINGINDAEHGDC